MARPTLATVFTAQDFMSPQIKKMQDSVNKFSNEIEGMNRKNGDSFSKLKTLIISGIAGYGVKSAFEYIIKAASQTEKFQTVLQTTFTNSTEALANGMSTVEYATKRATESMAMIQDFASRTPYQVNELTGSFVKLANRGMVPTMEKMEAFGDIAASQGKSFDQFTEAVLDAVTGEFERMKEFGIKASKEKGKVIFAFKGMNVAIRNTPEEIEKVILAFGKMEGVTGSMNNVSKTFSGMSSTLKDNIDLIAVKIGTSFLPHLNKIITELLKITDSISTWMTENDKLISQGIDKFFETLSDAISILKTGLDTGLIPALITMKLTFEAGKLAVAAHATAITAYSVLQTVLDIGLVATTKLIIAQNAAWMASPIGMVVLAMGALISAVILVWSNFEILDKWISSVFNWLWDLDEVLQVVIVTLGILGMVAFASFAPITATVMAVIFAIYALIKAYKWAKSQLSGEPLIEDQNVPELPGMSPIERNNLQSANSGLLSKTINRNNNSNVVVDFKNLPQFANVTQKGMAPNISVNTGKFVNPFAPVGFNPLGY
jgi:hypothetical protein